MKLSALIISAFPGTGKSTAYTLLKDKYRILDSDSVELDKRAFPDSYISSIEAKLYDYDIIFVSSHESVRNALKEHDIPFTLFYPDKHRKEEFIRNYKNRLDNKKTTAYIKCNFDKLINNIESEDYYNKIKLIGNDNFIMNNDMFLNLLRLIDEEKKRKEI